MHDSAVALTDFALAIECGTFSVLVARKLSPNSNREWLRIFFVSIAVGALLGGLTHGYFPNDTPMARAIWSATMLAIGVTALACWNLGAELLHRHWRPVRMAAWAAFCIYASFVLYGWRAYRFVIADYLPAACFLLVTCAIAAIKGERHHLVTASGIVLTFVAATIQLAHIGVAMVNHNALYHVVQGIALLLIYIGFVPVGTVRAP